MTSRRRSTTGSFPPFDGRRFEARRLSQYRGDLGRALEWRRRCRLWRRVRLVTWALAMVSAAAVVPTLVMSFEQTAVALIALSAGFLLGSRICADRSQHYLMRYNMEFQRHDREQEFR